MPYKKRNKAGLVNKVRENLEDLRIRKSQRMLAEEREEEAELEEAIRLR